MKLKWNHNINTKTKLKYYDYAAPPTELLDKTSTTDCLMLLSLPGRHHVILPNLLNNIIITATEEKHLLSRNIKTDYENDDKKARKITTSIA